MYQEQKEEELFGRNTLVQHPLATKCQNIVMIFLTENRHIKSLS